MPLFFPSQHLKMGGVAPGMAVRGTEAESRIDLSQARVGILLFLFACFSKCWNYLCGRVDTWQIARMSRLVRALTVRRYPDMLFRAACIIYVLLTCISYTRGTRRWVNVETTLIKVRTLNQRWFRVDSALYARMVISIVKWLCYIYVTEVLLCSHTPRFILYLIIFPHIVIA